MNLFGRQKLYCGYEKIDESNIREVLLQLFPTILLNRGNIEYLFDYYKGNQPILCRKKNIREDINNKIVENHANEIVSFKAGYLLNKPIQYVARNDGVDTNSINDLNSFLLIQNKNGKDKILANNQSICGTAYRLVLPSNNKDCPFDIYNIDPRQGFVIYSTRLGNKPLFGGFIYVINDKSGTHNVVEGYTEDSYFYWEKDNLIKKPNPLGMIPIIEYPLNEERLGDFEKVLPLLDAINNVQSNRVDGVEQFIQALLVFKNVDIDTKDLEELKKLGAIKIKDNGSGEKKVEANVNYLTQELNQTQTQTLIDYMYKIVLTICGMPNRNGGSSTSDTGNAVIMRDGWSDAEARASDTESMFRTSEIEFLKIALHITRALLKGSFSLSLKDIDIKFTRRNYENIYQKAQVLDLMLKNPRIDPKYAFIVSGLFSDPELAFQDGEKHYKEVMANEINKEQH